MKPLRKSILIALTVLGMGTAALTAHAGQERSGNGASMEQKHARMAEHFAEHQARLHDKLKLSASQEGAWNTYAAAIKQAAPGARLDRAALAKLPAPERLAKMIELAKAHTTAMEAHLAALKTFYATLTPEQKKVFDDNMMGGEHGRQGMQHR